MSFISHLSSDSICSSGCSSVITIAGLSLVIANTENPGLFASNSYSVSVSPRTLVVRFCHVLLLYLLKTMLLAFLLFCTIHSFATEKSIFAISISVSSMYLVLMFRYWNTLMFRYWNTSPSTDPEIDEGIFPVFVIVMTIFLME